MWEKIKAWFIAKWTEFKTWFLAKPWAWFKKNWMIITNYFVIVLAYNNVYNKAGVGLAEILLGLWIFVSLGYVGYKWFIKTE